MKSKALLLVCAVFAVSLFFFAAATARPVSASVRCSPAKCSGNCQPEPQPRTGTSFASASDKGAYQKCCCSDNQCPKGGKDEDCSVKGAGKCTCGNCAWFVDEEECQCTPVSCENVPGDKFRTNETVETGRTCINVCKPQTTECKVLKNSPPSCSMLPTSISMNRDDAPKQIELTVTDQDYGDTVEITGTQTLDTAGDVNSCVRVTTLGGGNVLNTVVRVGSGDSAKISQTTAFLADPRGLHGVYGVEAGTGKSVCAGKLEVEIRDIDSDGPGGLDTSDVTKCSIDIKVYNEAPRLTNVTITDGDTLTGVSGIPESGNLLDGRSLLYVGSPLERNPAPPEAATEERPSYCSKPLKLNALPILCSLGDQSFATNGTNWNVASSRKRNPFELSFTVSDANGRSDIMQAGLWIQREEVSSTDVELPLVNSGTRNSFQAMYSEKENIQVATGNARWNFVSRACFGSACGPTELQNSSKQLFSGLGYIPSLGSTVSSNGNVKIGNTGWASQREWQKKGFPDCLESTAGCKNSNVPANALLRAPIGDSPTTRWENYEWAVAAEESQLICFKSNSMAPSVVALGAQDECPKNCAACMQKKGVVALNANSLRFTFKVYLNDQSTGLDGMLDGEYGIFVSALDKVSAPLHNVRGKTDDGWIRFTKDGAACTRATCPAGEEFTLVYDSTPPTTETTVTGPVDANNDGVAEEMNITYRATDNLSGVAGITNRYAAISTTIDGVPEPPTLWAKRLSGADFNGENDAINFAATVNPRITVARTLPAMGIPSGGTVVAGACAFDFAGNMGCGGNTGAADFLKPWLKTSYGDIYSNTSGNAFSLSLPTNEELNDRTRKVSPPFVEQIFTAGTGILLSGGSSSGLSGGYWQSSTLPTTALGFSNWYRPGDPNNTFNTFGYKPAMPGAEYARLYAQATLNCESLGNRCTQGSTNLQDVQTSTKEFTIIKLNGNVDYSAQNLSCTQVNLIFVESGKLTLSTVTRPPGANGCMFVVNNGAALEVIDSVHGTRNEAGKAPPVDDFQAAVVTSGGGFSTPRSSYQSMDGTDRLVIRGWVYSSNSTPTFGRWLAQADITEFPAEWILYDAALLDSYRMLVGSQKTADMICGASSHILCR